MLIVKLICKECYNKKYGELPKVEYGMLYQTTDEKMECEECGKEDNLIYTTESADPKKCKLKFK